MSTWVEVVTPVLGISTRVLDRDDNCFDDYRYRIYGPQGCNKCDACALKKLRDDGFTLRVKRYGPTLPPPPAPWSV